MKYLSLLIILLLIGCSSTKSVVQTTNTVKKDSSATFHSEKHDSIHNLEKIVYIPVTADVNLGNPCDSVGNLKPIDLTSKIGNYKATISTLNNKLQINIAQIDTIVSRYEFLKVENQKKDSINKSLLLKQSVSKNKTIYLPTKWTWYFLIGFIISTALHFVSLKNIISKIKKIFIK